MHSFFCDILYYIYVLLFGVYVSTKICCGTFSAREWKFYAVLCPSLLLLQGACLQFFGLDPLWMLYPWITHLPTVLATALCLKIQWSTSLVAVFVSYSLCQLLRWIGLIIDVFELLPIAALIIHLALCQLLLVLLDRYFLRAIHDVIDHSARLLKWFGALPVIYYFYEYFVIYTQNRYERFLAFNELLPTAMVLFFILFIMAYQKEMEKRIQAEQQTSALEAELSRAGHEIAVLRVIEDRTAIYRHDLRHHLTMISSLLSAGNPDQATQYIHRISDEIEAITPIRYCENETINLLLCAFTGRAAEQGIRLSAKTSLPKALSLPDTELCAILSNGLENAANAVGLLPDGADRTIDVFCGVKQNNLLIEIKNPYAGEIVIQDGLPFADDQRRHYGCRSIQSIVRRRNGICTFDAADGTFVLRAAIPLQPPLS